MPSSFKCRVIARIALAAAIAPLTLAGPLDPPAGPIESTNKPLSEIEPRTALSSTNTPGTAQSRYVISTSGSYYLVAGSPSPLIINHIEIGPSATNVTIDLMGHMLTVSSSRAAITAPAAPAARTIVIRNGTIRGSGPSNGILVESDATVIIEDVRFESLSRVIDVAGAATVRRCDVRNCNLSGLAGVSSSAAIDVGNDSIVENCRVDTAIGSGSNPCIRVGSNSVVRDCVLTQINTGEIGIDAGSTCIIENNVIRNDGDAATFTAVQVGSAAIVRDNVFSTTASGTHIGVNGSSITTVVDNVFSAFDTAVSLGNASDCLVVRNHFRGASTAIDANFPGSNIFGPLITAGGAAASNNPHANYSN